MLKRGTLLLLLSAIALGGAVLLLENRSGPRSEESPNGETEAASEKLFPFEEEEVEQFSVTRQEGDVAFVKNDDGTWQMTAPDAARAEGGAIAFLLSQVTTSAAVPVVVDADSLEEFGLAKPDSTVSLTANGRDYRLHVGGLDFLNDKRYVQAIESPAVSTEDAPAQTSTDTDETVKIYAVSGNILNAVNRPAEDWLVIDSTAVEGSAEDSDSAEPSVEVEGAADVSPKPSTPAKPPAKDSSKTDALDSDVSETDASEADSTETEGPSGEPNSVDTEEATTEEATP